LPLPSGFRFWHGSVGLQQLTCAILQQVWDIPSRTIKHTFSGHEQDIYSLDFSRNGRHIASGSGDRTVRLWDVEASQNILTVSIEDGVTTVAISPDGRYLAAGSLDKSVRVWDTSSGAVVERLDGPDGHRDSVYSVAFAPNGRDLVSGSLDKTIKLWELPSRGGLGPKGGKCTRTFEGHKVSFFFHVATLPARLCPLRHVSLINPLSAPISDNEARPTPGKTS
jgi:glucose repression regulatory protein TUP1